MPLCRLFWRTRGAFSLSVNFDPDKDYSEFGPQLAHNLTATYKFDINSSGEWHASVSVDFVQPENTWDYHQLPLSDTNLTHRVIRLATAKGLNKEANTIEDINKEREELVKQYQDVDFSFTLNEKVTGKW